MAKHSLSKRARLVRRTESVQGRTHDMLLGNCAKKKQRAGCFFVRDGSEDQAVVADLPLEVGLRAYFCLNFSTRPAVSTIFCLPV